MGVDVPALLIVGDAELNRAILYEMFRGHFGVLEAGGEAEALEALHRHRAHIRLVLLDGSLSGGGGLQVLRQMQKEGFLPGVPVLMIVASGASSEKIAAAMQLGVVDFIERPFNIDIVKSRVLRLLEHQRCREKMDEMVEARTREMRRTSRLAIEALSTIVEFRSGETAMHTRRIGLITRMLCQALVKRFPEWKLSDSMIEDIVCASALHDVGMIAVPETILNKPGRLSEEEFDVMKRHTVFGAQVLERISSQSGERFFTYCRDICLCHHERWDGNGYPNGIAGDEIPIWAQVVSLADVYDVLTSERVYKPPFTHEQALHMIEDGDCGAFNPKLLMILGLIESKLMDGLNELAGDDDHGREAASDGAPPEPLSPRTLNLIEYEREQYKAFASLSGEVLLDYDAQSDAISFSERACEHFEGDIAARRVPMQEVIARYLYPQDKKTLTDALAGASAENAMVRLEIRLLTKHGWYEWYEVVARTLWDDDAPSQCVRALGKLTNIDKSVRETCRLREQATRDVLTGLLNRGEIERCIRQRIREDPDGQGALLYIDIDDFKGINDAHGHVFGDEVLRKIGRSVQANIRESDIAGRIGGDEFVVYLDRVRSEEGITGNVERLITVMRQGFSIRAERAPVSISVGIARFPQDGTRYETLLEKADQAMYISKYGGKLRGASRLYSSAHSAGK